MAEATLPVGRRIRRAQRQVEHAIERPLEAAAVVAAIATIPLTIAQEHGYDADPIVQAANWAVWLVFLVEYVIMLPLVKDRWAFTRRNWLNVAIIVLTFPLLPHALEVVRVARLLRLVAVASWGIHEFDLIFGRTGVRHVAMIAVFLILGGGGLLAMAEPETVKGDYWNGVWWAVVTFSTVGYGDISPTTIWGRITAVAIMLSSIGLTSVLAAAIAAHFVGQDSGERHESLEDRLARIERLLEQLTAASAAGAGPQAGARRPEQGAEEQAASRPPAPSAGAGA